MELKIYQVDAFTDHLFGGNPAAVCPLKKWLPDETMQNIAAENNLSETAFFAEEGEGYRLRWFTPTLEVDLCGHATLAASHVLWNHLGYPGSTITFQSRSGMLNVTREGNRITLDFPADSIERTEPPEELLKSLNHKPLECCKGRSDYLLLFDKEKTLLELLPDFKRLTQVKSRGVIVTAPGTKTDFVSRFFGPQSGVDEDPVTGSAHTTLAVYWSQRLGKSEFTAAQVSKRRGDLRVKLSGNRVLISGGAVTYLEGIAHC